MFQSRAVMAVLTVLLGVSAAYAGEVAQAAVPVGRVTTTQQAAPVSAGTPAAATPPANAPVVVTTTTETTVSKTNEYVFDPTVITVTRELSAPDEYSERKYQDVAFTLKNTLPVHVELVQVEVPEGLDEQMLAQKKAEASNRKRRIAGGLLGATSYIPFVGGIAGAATGMALAVGTGVASHAGYVIQNMPDGSQGVTGQYVKRLNNVVISPGQTFTFKSIVSKEAAPHLRLVIKDLTTNRIVDATH